jgi:hypothetical protein
VRHKKAHANTPTVKELEADFAAERAQTRIDDLKAAMNQAPVRRVLFELLYDPCTGLGFDATPVLCEPLAQAGHAAQRACARIWVERMKREVPTLYLEMLEEQLEQKAEKQRLREDSLAAEQTQTEGEEP